MQQHLTWKPWSNPGVENLRLKHDAGGIHASSHLIQNLRGHSIAATYVLNCDPRWRFRRLWLQVDNHGQRSLILERDIRGRWLLNGEPRNDLGDCQQVMLSASPFTHTPALQRCALETGQSAALQVAWIDMLSLKVEARQQRYLCLRQQSDHTLYRCEAEGKPPRELTVDPDALLIDAREQYQRMSVRTLQVSPWV
ncbi:putative glycolipid-binding domain-containing protein [Pseudomonas sp. UL073]|uniref:Glycolipid-binding domain-containing protein n=1 Tax=Zestomonas insulae TaxID=2809017 RepID=A0ABS2IAW5_9GAMM|nr:putative glycolipid-binding domain-containing protein [Pseudomonas insulae]MBM7060107.1 putative glycolipid-binding domain-containing protein [Pseudomonas insulae]